MFNVGRKIIQPLGVELIELADVYRNYYLYQMQTTMFGQNCLWTSRTTRWREKSIN